MHAAACYSRYGDFIGYTNLGVVPGLPQFGLFVIRADGIGKAKVWGAELASRFELGEWASAARGVSVALAAGRSRGNATNLPTGEKGGLGAVLGLGYDDPGQRFGGALHTTWTRSKQADAVTVIAASTAPVEKFRVPTTTVLDLTGYWNITRNVTWRAGLYNLTGRKYWDYASVRDLSATAIADIERQARPGRSIGASPEVQF